MSSYKKIIKASGLVGIAQVIQIFLGIVRNKFIAVIIGASGFGIWALYNSFLDMLTKFSILGLDKSGVKEIAKYKENEEKTHQIINTLKISVFVTSSVTSLVCILLSKSISTSLFNTSEYYVGVIIVSIVVILKGLSNTYISILNGFRNIKNLVISQIIGAFIGTVAAISLVFVYGVKGIPFYILILGFTLLTSTWYYARRLNIKFKVPKIKTFLKEFKILINIGLGFSIAAAIGAVITYISRIYISNEFDLSSVGIYQACWMMSNIYISMILRAMGIDLMPRLSKIIEDKVKTNQLVNEQMELGLLVSGIGIIGVLIYSPIALELVYSDEFTAGVSIIQWQIIGVSLRVLGFPFSYVIILRGKSVTYVIVQIVFWISDYLFLVLFSNLFGFDGLGINYFASYLIYISITWIINYKIIDFKPSKLLISLMSKIYLFILVTLISTLFIPNLYTYLMGVLFIGFYLIWMIIRLKDDMEIDVMNILKNKFTS